MATTVGFGCAASALGTAPALTVVVPAGGGSTNSSTPTFSGTASNDVGDTTVTVKVYAGPSASGTPVQTLSPTRTGGSWSVGASSVLVDGVYTVQAAQQLSIGSALSSANTFTVDTVAPSSSAGALPSHEKSPTFGVGYSASDPNPTSRLAKVELFLEGPADSGFVKVGQVAAPGATGVIGFTAGEGGGVYRVYTRATDLAGNTEAAPGTADAFTIVDTPPPANLPPSASFLAFPGAPLTGDPVTLFSTSSDPDGPIASQVWDLNGDGIFADASGPTATASFTTAGPHIVSLWVTDTGGASAVASRVLTVASRPVAAASTPQLLSPFPNVRIAGRATRSGVTLRLIVVETAAGSRVELRCRGRGCPRRSQSRVAPGRPGSGGFREVSFPRFARSLRSGVVLEIRVTKSGRIGKYTRFVIQRNRAPRRTDSCLLPGRSAPKACPAS